jgi:hypothetical protein
MGHLVKLNIRIDIISQNDQLIFIKSDIMPTTYLFPTSHLQFYNLLTYPPTHLFPTTYLPSYLIIL